MTIGRTLCALGILLGVATFVRAEPWERGRVRREGRPVVIAVDDRATEARLVVPRDMLRHIDLASIGPDIPATADTSLARRPLLPVGIALGTALAVAGLYLTGARPRLGVRRAAAVLGVVALGAVGAAVAWGKAQPAEVPPAILRSQVKIEVVDQGDAIKLMLPRAMFKDLPH